MGSADSSHPFMGEEIWEMKYPYVEAVVEKPAPTGRRRMGVFGNIDESSEVFYAPIEAYEGRHRYDASFEWEPKEEKRLVRKVSSCLKL